MVDRGVSVYYSVRNTIGEKSALVICYKRRVTDMQDKNIGERKRYDLIGGAPVNWSPMSPELYSRLTKTLFTSEPLS